MFGYRASAEPTSGRLTELLNRQEIALEELLAVPNIMGDIKASSQKFVTFLQTRRALALKLIDYATTKPVQDETLRRICYCATQLLSSDQEALVTLYFGTPTDDSEQSSQQIAEEIEIEKLLGFNDKEITDGNDPLSTHELLDHLLSFLKTMDMENEAVNGYFLKVLTPLLRKRGADVILRFMVRPELEDCLFANFKSPSIVTLLVKILHTEDQIHEVFSSTNNLLYIQAYKTKLVDRLVSTFFSQVEDLELAESVALFFEEAFSTIKNKYFEFPQDFVRCMNKLVSATFIDTCFEKLSNPTPNCMLSICSVLTLIVRKRNTEAHDFAANLKERREAPVPMTQQDFILNFQLQRLCHNFGFLVNLLKHATFRQSNSYSKFKVLEMLSQISKMEGVQTSNPPDQQTGLKQMIGILLGEYCAENKGIVKTEILELLRKLISISSLALLQQIGLGKEENLQKILPILAQRGDMSFSEQNKWAQFSFERLLLMLIRSKIQLPEAFQTKAKSIQQRESKILGGFNPRRKNDPVECSPFDQPDPFQKVTISQLVSIMTMTSITVQEQKTCEVQLVGKLKNIALPNLRYMCETKKNKPVVTPLIISDKILEEEKKLVVEIEEQDIVVIVKPSTEETINTTVQQSKENDSPKVTLVTPLQPEIKTGSPLAVVHQQVKEIKTAEESRMPFSKHEPNIDLSSASAIRKTKSMMLPASREVIQFFHRGYTYL